MLRSDSRDDAVEASTEYPDARLMHYWDENKITGDAFQEPLQISTTVWDVYLLYNRTAQWQNPAPVPDFWMHQLGWNAPAGPALDETELIRQVQSKLAP